VEDFYYWLMESRRQLNGSFPFPFSDGHKRQSVIVTEFAMEFQHIVKGTPGNGGITAANLWTGFVDRASSIFKIQKPTRASQNGVGLSPEHSLARMQLCELLNSLFTIHSKIPSQTHDVPLSHDDQFIDRAAIARAF